MDDDQMDPAVPEEAPEDELDEEGMPKKIPLDDAEEDESEDDEIM
jgi:hypothetical protein